MPAASNPFRQRERQWQIRIFVDRSAVAAAEEAFEDVSQAVSSFEIDETTAAWRVDIITDVPPEKMHIDARLALVSGLLGILTPQHEVQELKPKDWAAEVEKNFPPFSVGRFYVRGSGLGTLPPGAIELLVSAGAAFGSGEHATTRGCLLALNMLAKRRRFRNPLDMGCGSGILAIAMAKLWPTRVTGVDIDPVSVSVAKANAQRNRVGTDTCFVAGDGYHAPIVSKQGPFDLIVANILARPLAKMAPQLARHLAFGGYAVLSGLLITQERRVLAAHCEQGLRLVSRLHSGGWSTLILRA